MLDKEVSGSRGIEMGTLIFICPGTRQTVSTGIKIDPASFSTLESDGLWEVHHPQCSEALQISQISVYLKRDGTEPSPISVTG
jgi:hypothetical protein